MTDVVSQYVSGRTVQEQMCELMKFVSTVNGKSVKKIEGSQSDDTVTVTVTYEDDRTDVFSFQSTPGVTIDTAQTVSGMKVFSAASTQFTHDVDVGGDLNVATTVEANELTVDTDATIDGNATVDGNLSVGGNVAITGNVTTDLNVVGDIANHHMAIEEDSGNTVFSVDSNLRLIQGVNVPVSDNTDKIATTKWINDARNADTKLVRTTGNQTVAGNKTFTGNIIAGLPFALWCEYPGPSDNWVKMFKKASSNIYAKITVADTNGGYMEAIFFSSNAVVNGNKIVSTNLSGVSVAVDYDGTYTNVYLKVPSAHNWTATIVSWSRYRNDIVFDVVDGKTETATALSSINKVIES